MKKEKIKKIINIWYSWLIDPILSLTKKKNMRGEVSEQLLIGICKRIDKKTSCFASCNLRPKDPLLCEQYPKHCIGKSIAIVMQGPILKDEDFTLNTVKCYKRIPSVSYVIVSTWNTENEKHLKQIEDEGAIIVSTPLPECPGIGNLNYQLISMKAGIKKALELGADYICKTRTDQRIYKEFAFDFMYNLLQMFPSGAEFTQSNRIVALATEYENMFYPYYISDFLYFGNSNDMKKFLEIREETRDEKPPFINYKERIQTEANAEIFIARELIKVCGGGYGDSIKEYWRYIKDAFILIDKSIIGLYWNKYDNKYCEHKRNGNYFTNSTSNKHLTLNFDFLTWLSLYYDQISYDDAYEKILLREEKE